MFPHSARSGAGGVLEASGGNVPAISDRLSVPAKHADQFIIGFVNCESHAVKASQGHVLVKSAGGSVFGALHGALVPIFSVLGLAFGFLILMNITANPLGG